MNTITAILEPDPDGTLHLPVPEGWRHRAIKVKAEMEPLDSGAISAAEASPSELKGFGCLRGKIWISADFNEPLEDFQDYSA